jgi:hypothetical protein
VNEARKNNDYQKETTMMSRCIFAITVIALAMQGAYAGKADILSDTLNVRTSGTQGTGKCTKHYGYMVILTDANTDALSVLNANTSSSDANVGVRAVAFSNNNYGIGVYAQGGHYGLKGVANSAGGGVRYGGYFDAVATSTAYGVYAVVSGTAPNRYAVFGSCSDTTGQHWAGYFSGKIYATALRQPSDARLKTNAAPITGGLAKVMQLKPQSYLYDLANNPKMNLPLGRQYGLIAQELEQVLPDLVTEVAVPDTSRDGNKTPETFKSICYTELIPFLIAAIQEQQKRIVALEAALGK